MMVATGAFAQWAPTPGNANNIYNTNSGFIGMGTQNPLNQVVLSSDTQPFFQINTNATCGPCNPGFALSLNGTYYAYVGVAGGNGSGIGGTARGDVYVRSENHAIYFSTNAGTSPMAYFSGTDATFGGNVSVSGNIAAKYQDVAEWVPSKHALTPGTVVVLDTTAINHVEASAKSYDTRVAGVVSEKPGVILGTAAAGKEAIATTGRVRVKVDATKNPIEVGDLLVTSDRPGTAMKSMPVMIGDAPFHRPGTIIGKALEPLKSGEGEVLVLLSLQ